jgi:hypothetical protein
VIDFTRVNEAALTVLPVLVARWLPNGRRIGREYVALNPRRIDRRPGSFRINLTTGRWGDFATGDTGGDPISLAAFLFDLSQYDAAQVIAGMLGVREGSDDHR